ncbi:MAG: DoxX family protein [Acidobacteria bacterium]|nr:DoxX family protein [Acidobacteriota bacterium]
MKFLRSFDEASYTAMRVMLAFLYTCHGLQKVFGLMGGHAFPLTSQLGVAGLLETILGLLIGGGALTSWAAFVASGEMAFAYFIGHSPHGFWPAANGGDIAVALCFAFLYIAARGGGAYSVDALLSRDR